MLENGENKEARSLHALLHAIPFADRSRDDTLSLKRRFEIGFKTKKSKNLSAHYEDTEAKAHTVAEDMCIPQKFKMCKKMATNFMERNGPSLRQCTSVFELLPESYKNTARFSTM